jgi:S1-C subfamily serine protease
MRKGIAAKRESGLLVVATNFNGASENTDMFIGDVLLDVDNNPLDDVTSLLEGLAHFDAKDKVRFQVIRGGNITVVEVPLQSLERTADLTRPANAASVSGDHKGSPPRAGR